MDLSVPPGGFMQPSMSNLPPSINMASFASLAGIDPSIAGMMELERQYGLNPLAGMVPMSNTSSSSIHAPAYNMVSFPTQAYTMGAANYFQPSIPTQQSIPSPGGMTPKSDSSGSTLPTEPVSMLDKFFEASRPGTPGTPPMVPANASEHQFSPGTPPSFAGINPMQGQPLQNFLERGFSPAGERSSSNQTVPQFPDLSNLTPQPMMPPMASPMTNGTKHGLEISTSQLSNVKKQKLSPNSEALHDMTNTVLKKEPCPTKITIKGSDWESKINVKLEPYDQDRELEEGEIIKNPERRDLEERYYQDKDPSKTNIPTIRVKKEMQEDIGESISESEQPRTSTPTPTVNMIVAPPINSIPFGGSMVLQVNNRGKVAGAAKARGGTQRGRGATRARGSALRGMSTGARVPNPAMRGMNPAMRGMNPAMRGMNPAMRGMNPAMQGMNPAMQGMNPAMRGMNTALRGMPPGARGMNPAMRGMHPGMRGMNPGVRGMNPGARGMNPRMRGMPALTRGASRGGRGAHLIDIADSPPASPAKNPALDKLKACGISVSVQKTPEIPKGLNLPAGISICHAPSGYPTQARNFKSPGEGSNAKRASFEKTSPSQKTSLSPNIAQALASAAVPDNGPKTKVELDLSSSQMAALRMLGLL